MSLFKTPHLDTTAPPDPADLANRKDSLRRARLATGGVQSTLLSGWMRASGQGAPATSAITGVG